jgi:YHS domain-containing protein
MTKTRITLSILALLAAAPLVSIPAEAKTQRITLQDMGEMSSYDVVAYFTKGQAMKGSPELTATHDGRTYTFATPEHRAMFLASPQQYVPAYGGLAADGLMTGKQVAPDPTRFAIIDNKLYFLSSADGQKQFMAKPREMITAADTNWSKLNEGG